MRVFLISRNYFPAGVVGGAQASVKFLAQELQLKGHDVAVLSIDDHPHTGIHEESGIMEYRIKNPNPYTKAGAGAAEKALWHSKDRFLSQSYNEYKKVFMDFKPDVINTNVMAGIGVGIWNVAHKMNIPIIHTIHDYYLTCIKSSMRSGNVNCADICFSCRLAALNTSMKPSRYVGDVIYVSRHMKTAHEKAGLFSPKTRAHIIHGSYPLDNIPHREKAAPNTGHPITLGFFGRISPEKGVEELLKALKKLPSDSWTLRIGGSGEAGYVEKVKKIAAGMPVEFLGFQTPNEFYSSVDAVIIYSLWNDPAPRVAYEAGCHGVIPIVTNRGGLPELVADGERGYVFDPESPDSLFAAIKDLVGHPEKVAQMKKKWDQAKEIFAPETVAEQTLAIYRAAVASK